MENLYELARITKRNRRVMDCLIPPDDNSPLKKLFLILYSNEVLDDNECMIEIYGKRKLVAFSRLKSRLKDIFYQGVFIQNLNEDNGEPKSSEINSTHKQTVIARILRENNANKLAIELLEKSIIKTIKYHVTENVLSQARILSLNYSSVDYNKYKFEKYLSIQEKYLRIYEWEIRAENFFLELQRTTIQSLGNPSDETKKKARNFVKILSEVKDIKSHNFIYNKFRVMASYYEYEKDYTSLLSLSETTLKEFNSAELKSSLPRTNISLRRMWALIQAGRIDETVNIGLKELSKAIPGSVTWYRIAHYTLKGLMFRGDYKKAIDLISTMINHQKFSKLSENYREVFYTTLGYLHLVVESGIAGDKKDMQKKLPEFKLGKFLNTTPVFSKDKRGINVSILLMHIAFLLQRKDYNAIIDRIDSLNQYAYRYLRKDDSYRSNCMIKMVIQMTKADFNPIRTERYTAELHKQFELVPLAGSGENIEIEMIPFETLWDIMVKAL